MKDDNRRAAYVVLVGLLTFLLTACVLYQEAVDGIWRPPPVVVSTGTRVDGLLAQIPVCVKKCIFQRIDTLGCAHTDYACLCREFERLEPEPDQDFSEDIAELKLQEEEIEIIDDDGNVVKITRFSKVEEIEPQRKEVRESRRDLPEGSNSEAADPELFSECVNLCANGASLFWFPAQMLEVCDAVEEHAHLPEFMLKTLALYPRQSYSNGTGTGVVYLGTTTTRTTSTSRTSSTLTTTPTTSPTTSPTSTRLSATTRFTSLSSGLTPYTSTFTGLTAMTVEVGFTGTATPTPTITPAPTPEPTTESGMSMGAKIGLGVAIPLVLLLIGALVFFFMRRRKQRAAVDDTNRIPELTEETSSRNELESGAYIANREKKVAETAGNQIHELDRQQGGETKIAELKGDTKTQAGAFRPYELPENTQPTSPRYELIGATAITHEPPPEMPRSPPPAVMRKPLSPSTSLAAPVTSHFPAPWETTPAESAFTAVYPAPGPAKSQQEEDRELQEMEAEMARVQEEKDRLRRMQSLEVREKELRRGIEARKRGSGANPGGASGSGNG